MQRIATPPPAVFICPTLLHVAWAAHAHAPPPPSLLASKNKEAARGRSASTQAHALRFPPCWKGGRSVVRRMGVAIIPPPRPLIASKDTEV
eukprot:115950-Chlamydomonas_euryale.AAC.2